MNQLGYWSLRYQENNYKKLSEPFFQRDYEMLDSIFITHVGGYRYAVGSRKDAYKRVGTLYTRSMAKRKIKLRVYPITTLIRKKKKK